MGVVGNLMMMHRQRVSLKPEGRDIYTAGYETLAEVAERLPSSSRRYIIPTRSTRSLGTDRQQNLKPDSLRRRLCLKPVPGLARGVHSDAGSLLGGIQHP